MSTPACERSPILPSLITDLKLRKEAKVIVNELSKRVPQVLHPHLPQYVSGLANALTTSPIDNLLVQMDKTYQEILPLREKMCLLQPEQNGDLEQQITALRRRKTAAARRPEPLPTTLRPAVGRSLRAFLAVVGLKFSRPDLDLIDRNIAELSPRLPKHQELQALLEQDNRLSAKLAEGQERLLCSFDQWAVQKIPRALIYLVEEPERLPKIIKAHRERTSRNPLPEEAIWYVSWVLSNARHLYNSGTYPEIFKKWFTLQFPNVPIDKIAQIHNLFLPAILSFSSSEWSLLAPLNLKPEIINQAHQTLKTNEFKPGKEDLTLFLQWAFLTTAKRVSVLTSPKEETPSPRVCPPPKHERHEKPLLPTVHPVAQAETKPLLPIIVIQPVGTDRKFTLTPGEEISDEDLAKEIRDVFNLKENDPKIRFYLISIKSAQMVFWQGLKTDIAKIRSHSLQKRLGANLKIRRDDWQIVFSVSDVNGTPTITITWIGTHGEFERR